jgi:hypothetical protein
MELRRQTPLIPTVIDSPVLIRADGAREWPLSTTVFSCRAHQADSQAVVIDVVDAAGGGYTHFQRRIEGYERRGWRVEGPVDVVLGKTGRRRGAARQRKTSPR